MGLKSADITIYNIAPSIYTNFLKSSIQIQKKVSISLEISSNVNVAPSIVFSGLCTLVSIDASNHNTIGVKFDAFDGGEKIQNALSNFKLNNGATILELKKQYANSLGMDIYSKSDNDAKILKNGFSSNTKTIWTEIKDIFADEEVFIDNNKIYFLDSNYFNTLKSQKKSLILSLSEKTGLFGVPEPNGNTLVVKHKLLPSVKRSQILDIQSKSQIDNRFNGIYRVIGYKHRGRISYVKAEQNTTEIELRKLDNSPLGF